MQVKLMSLIAGIVALTVVAAPLTAQACNGRDKEKNTQESSYSIPTETSLTTEANFLAS